MDYCAAARLDRDIELLAVSLRPLHLPGGGADLTTAPFHQYHHYVSVPLDTLLFTPAGQIKSGGQGRRNSSHLCVKIINQPQTLKQIFSFNLYNNYDNN